MNNHRQILEIERQGTRIPIVRIIIAVFLLLLAVLILLDSWSKSRNLASPIEIFLGTPQRPSSEVTVISQDDVTVYMPPNATELDGKISIVVAQPNLSLVVDHATWIINKVANVEFRNPDGAPIPGIYFSEPLDICFSLTEEQWQAFAQYPDAFRIQHFADQENPPRWEPVPQVTHPDKLQLCGQTHALSMFGLAIKTQVGIPVTGLVMPLPSAGSISSVQDRERREMDTSDSVGTAQVFPTNLPPTQVPAVDLPATEVPLVQPQAIDPPPAEHPPADHPEQPPAGHPPADHPEHPEHPAHPEHPEHPAEHPKEKDNRQPDPTGSIHPPFGVFTDSLNG